MKVVILNAQVYPFCHTASGGAKYFYYLGKYLVQEGVEVEFVVSAIDGRKRESYEGMTYNFVKPFYPAVFDPQSKSALLAYARSRLFGINAARYLRGKEFDILHTPVFDVCWYLRFKHRKPVVLQTWEEPYMKPSSLTESPNIIYSIERKLGSSLTYYLFKYSLTHADAVTFSMDFAKEKMKELYHIDDDNLLYLPLGVDTSQIQRAVETGGVSRANAGIPEDSFIMTSVNHLYYAYDVDGLIDSLNLIRCQIDKVKLILIGAGPDEGRIIARIKELDLSNNVIHLKGIPEIELYSYYALSDIYVCPLLEDLSMGVIEAMACGLPIVSTAMDFCVREGVNGYVVPKRNPQAMADAVMKLYHKGDERKRMGEESKRIAVEYDWANIARMAITRYQKLLRAPQ